MGVMKMQVGRQSVHGLDVDSESRCAHWHASFDIVAIKMRCCDIYYACIECHMALADHIPAVWQRSEWGRRAVLCGSCKYELTIREYLASPVRCPNCQR